MTCTSQLELIAPESYLEEWVILCYSPGSTLTFLSKEEKNKQTNKPITPCLCQSSDSTLETPSKQKVNCGSEISKIIKKETEKDDVMLVFVTEWELH